MGVSALADHVGILQQFVSRFGEIRLFSTSAAVVTYPAPLYNVIGSTDDPKVPGYSSWTSLLQGKGIGVGSDNHCYVDPQVPDRSHPGFQVGGHMTPNQDGSVPATQSCYLMPLCKLHNGKGYNHVAMSHSLTQILELSGYMTGEPAATFLARMGGEASAALVFADEEGVGFQTLSAEDFVRAKESTIAEALGANAPSRHIVLHRRRDGDSVYYTVEHAQLD